MPPQSSSTWLKPSILCLETEVLWRRCSWGWLPFVIRLQDGAQLLQQPNVCPCSAQLLYACREFDLISTQSTISTDNIEVCRSKHKPSLHGNHAPSAQEAPCILHCGLAVSSTCLALLRLSLQQETILVHMPRELVRVVVLVGRSGCISINEHEQADP